MSKREMVLYKILTIGVVSMLMYFFVRGIWF